MVLVVVACGNSRDDRGAPPNAGPAQSDIPRVNSELEGRVVSSDGRPLADVAVQVSSESRDSGDGLLSLLTPCFFDSCDSMKPRFEKQTEADGRFSTLLPQAHIPGFEADTDWAAGVKLPPGPNQVEGPATVETFEVAAPLQKSPDLVVWTTPVVVDADRSRFMLRWKRLDAGSFDGNPLTRRLRYSVVLTTQERDKVWSWEDASPDDVLDARLLEDTNGIVRVVATGDTTSKPTIYHQTIAAGQVTYRGTAGPAPSRNAVCTLGSTPAAPTEPCWLTDGNLAHGRGGPETIPAAVIDLASQREVGLVVVRECSVCKVAFSNDGSAWSKARGDDDAQTQLINGRGRQARFVRISASRGRGINAAAEVSVWPPRRGPAPRRDGLLPPAHLAALTGVALAVLLLAAVAAVATFRRGGRRAQPR